MKEVWTVEVTDVKELLLAIASGNASLSFVSVSDTALNKEAQLLKEKYSVPGTRAVQKFVPIL